MADNPLMQVKELYTTHFVEEANEKLDEGWVLVDISTGLRRVWQELDGGRVRQFDAPHREYTLARIR